jgi:dihydrofolate synthase/folylpolyglutamate synthase
VVIGEYHDETAGVFESKAEETGSWIQFASNQYEIEVLRNNFEGIEFKIQSKFTGSWSEVFKTPLAGPYQPKNLVTLMAAALLLQRQGKIKAKDIQNGLMEIYGQTGLQGRWQLISRNPDILMDTAHNEGGLRMVFEAIAQHPHQQLHVVTGTLNDKEHSLLLPLYPKNAQYYFARPDIPRGMDAEKFKAMAAEYGCCTECGRLIARIIISEFA